MHGRPDTLTRLALTGLAVLPVSLLLAPDAAEVLYTLVSLAGLAGLLRNSLSRAETRQILLISLLPLAFFGVAALSVAMSGDYAGWFRPLKKLAELLATPFIALLLLRADIAPRRLLTVARLSALVLGAAALYQFVVLHNPRPGGAISPLPFAHVALLLAFFSLIRLPLERGWQRLFSLTAFGAGVLATLLSQSRIEWFNGLVLLAVLLFTWRRCGLLTRGALWAVVGCLLLTGMASLHTPLVHDRVAGAVNEYRLFQQQRDWETSVGQRLLMWRAGLAAAGERPLFGWGIHRSQQAAVSRLDDPRMREVLGEHHNLHNEYINSLAAKGVVGLLSLLALLFVPAAAFLARSTEPRLLVANAGGLLLCLSYAVSGMTYQAFGDDTMNVFFVLVLSCSLAVILREPVADRSRRRHVRVWPGRLSDAGYATGSSCRLCAPGRRPTG